MQASPPAYQLSKTCAPGGGASGRRRRIWSQAGGECITATLRPRRHRGHRLSASILPGGVGSNPSWSRHAHALRFPMGYDRHLIRLSFGVHRSGATPAVASKSPSCSSAHMRARFARHGRREASARGVHRVLAAVGDAAHPASRASAVGVDRSLNRPAASSACGDAARRLLERDQEAGAIRGAQPGARLASSPPGFRAVRVAIG